MKKIFIVLSAFICVTHLNAQQGVFKFAEIKEALKLAGYQVSGISNDTSFTSPNSTNIPTQYAVYKFVRNLFIGGGGTITLPASIGWDSVLNKPTTFTPSAHTHSISDVINLVDSLANHYTKVQSDLRYALISHTHTIPNITGLQSALDAKVPTSRSISINGVSKDLTSDPSFTVAGGGGSDSLSHRNVSNSGNDILINRPNGTASKLKVVAASGGLLYNLSFQSLSDMQAYLTTPGLLAPYTTIAQWTDFLRGGLFAYYPESAGLTVDNGTIFKRTAGGFWVRIYNKNDGADPLWFGATYDGAHDDQPAIQAACNLGGAVYINQYATNKMAVFGTTLNLKSNNSLIGTYGFELKLRDSANSYFIHNLGDSLHIDSNILIQGFVINQNGAAQVRGNPRCIGSNLVIQWVNNFTLQYCTIKNPVSYGAQIGHINRGYVAHIYLDYDNIRANNDGLHFNGGTQDLTVEDIYGTTNDDMVALNTDDGCGNYTHGYFRRIRIVNIHCKGNGYRGVRIMASDRDTIADVTVDGVTGQYRHNAVFISAYQWPTAYYVNVHVTNVSTYQPGSNEPTVWIDSTVRGKSLFLSYIFKLVKDTSETGLIKNSGYWQHLSISYIHVMDSLGITGGQGLPFIFNNEGTVNSLTMFNIKGSDSNAVTVQKPYLCVNTGNIPDAHFSDITGNFESGLFRSKFATAKVGELFISNCNFWGFGVVGDNQTSWGSIYISNTRVHGSLLNIRDTALLHNLFISNVRISRFSPSAGIFDSTLSPINSFAMPGHGYGIIENIVINGLVIDSLDGAYPSAIAVVGTKTISITGSKLYAKNNGIAIGLNPAGNTLCYVNEATTDFNAPTSLYLQSGSQYLRLNSQNIKMSSLTLITNPVVGDRAFLSTGNNFGHYWWNGIIWTQLNTNTALQWNPDVTVSGGQVNTIGLQGILRTLASGDTATVLDVNGRFANSFSSTELIARFKNNGILRGFMKSNGYQTWRLYNGTQEAGTFNIATPGGFPRVLLYDSTGNGASFFGLTGVGGGLSFGAGASSSTPSVGWQIGSDNSLIAGSGGANASFGMNLAGVASKLLGNYRSTQTQRDAISSPGAGGQFYNTTNNRLEVYNGTQFVGISNAPFVKQTGSSFTAVVGPNQFDPASLASTLTITLPASPDIGDKVQLMFGGTIAVGSAVITTLTISANTGQTLYGTAPTTANGGDYFEYTAISTTKWYRTK